MSAHSFPATIHQRALLEIVSDGTLVCRRDGLIIWANRAVSEVLGGSADIFGRNLDALFVEQKSVEQLLSGLHTDRSRPGSVVATAAGHGPEILISAHPGATPETILVTLRPFQSAVSSFDRAISFATRDPVTRLLNRDVFRERLAAATRVAPAGAAICANVDQFSTINEAYGTTAGDALLAAVAQRLRAVVSPERDLSRLYGGRFALFLTADDERTARAAATAQAEALHQSLIAPVTVSGGVQPITLSIGLAAWPSDGTDTDDLVGAIEGAIRSASRRGGRTFWFDPAMRSESRHFLEIEAELRQAIAKSQLSLAYQPKVRWSDRSVVGFEALVRWVHPQRGPISPGFFIPVAERSNLIVELGQWVIREACRQQAEWRETGAALLPVAVNVSPQQLLSQSIESLIAPVREFELPPGSIEIEITETAMMDRLPTEAKVIDDLRRSGLHVSIDDFGTGHSSLGNLRRLPIDVLKIDRSFVEDIEQSPEAYDIVATIVAMAKALSLDVIAEGVETEPQAALLRTHGVEIMQGFLFAKPLAADAAGALLASPSLAGDIN